MMGPDNRQLIKAAIVQDVTENGNSFYTRFWQVQNIPAKDRSEVATNVIKHNRKIAKAAKLARKAAKLARKATRGMRGESK